MGTKKDKINVFAVLSSKN